MNSASLDLMFNPRTVALIGASEKESKSGGIFLKSFINCGLQSELFLVNPNRREILGIKVYSNVLDIPEEIDLAIITVPASVTLKTVEECSKKGVKFILIHTSGFSEKGVEGRDIEVKMVQTARMSSSRVIGPNCLGVYCPETGLNTVAYGAKGLTEESGDVALVSHSGWACEYVVYTGYKLGLRFSKVVDLGNESDLAFVDLLEYLSSDLKTNTIAACLEGFRKEREIVDTVKKISKNKTVIIWKAGTTRAGTKAIKYHTGFLKDESIIHENDFKRAGIITAKSIEELIDLLIAFRSPYLPKGNHIGIIVEAGGAGIAAADACEKYGLNVVNLPKKTQVELEDLLRVLAPHFSGVSNPVDVGWSPTGQIYSTHPQVIEIISEAVDAFMIISYGPYNENYLFVLAKIMQRIKKPVVCVPLDPTSSVDATSWTKKRLPVYPTPERAARALSILAERHDFLKKT